MSGDTQAVYSGGYGSTSSVNNGEASSDTNCLIQASGRATPGMSGHHGTGDGSYEELLKDSVPCPTCRGLGRVPRDQEGELVALIPMKDKRLKPRRTVLYVAVAIMLCLLMAGLCMFFLFPRDVVITSNRPRLEPRTLHLNISATFVNFTIMLMDISVLNSVIGGAATSIIFVATKNFYNFTNNNFYPVKILGAQMTAMYDQRVMVTAANHTEVTVPIKSVVSYGILMTIVLSKNNDFGFLVAFCEDSRSWVHNLPITFDYYGKPQTPVSPSSDHQV